MNLAGPWCWSIGTQAFPFVAPFNPWGFWVR